MSKVRYKYCIVPYCKSTTIKTPTKIFFSVPVDEKKRKEWCLAIGRVPGKHKTLSVKCSRFVCEDHFDLEQDMDNYMMWKMVGVGKLLLKKGVIPHKLECQRDKRNLKRSDIDQNVPQCREDSETYHIMEEQQVENRDIKLQGTSSLLEARFYHIDKENNDVNHKDMDIAIKTEITESKCVSEQEPNVIVKNVVEDLDNYIFTVRYDSDTGGEYLIQNNYG